MPPGARSRVVALALAGALATLGSALVAARARASDDDAAPARGAHHVDPPPAPESHPATLAVDVHVGAAAPLERSAICPAGAGCVLGAGVGVGAQIERRAADGVGLFAGYDFWLLDSGGVYEIGALHALRGGVRWVIDAATLVHPFVQGSIGFLAFGDTADAAALGGLITAGAGVEIELTESVAFVSALDAWVLSTGPFRAHDGVLRSDPFGVNVALQITVGVAVLVGPSAVAR